MATETESTSAAADENASADAWRAQGQAASAQAESYDDNRAAILSRIEADRAAKAGGGTQAQEAQADPPEGASAAQVTVPAQAQAAAQEEKQPEKKPAGDEQALADALNELATRGRALAVRERQLKERETALAGREKQPPAQTQPAYKTEDVERWSRIDAAKASGDPIALLRAHGYTNKQIQEEFSLRLLEGLPRLGVDDNAPPNSPAVQPKFLTEEQAAALFAKQAKDRADAEAQARAQEAAKTEEQAQGQYYSAVAQEFKSGQYPLTAAIRPTLGEMDAAFRSHLSRTGEYLSPQKLLAAFEERYKAAGVTVAPKAAPSKVTPVTGRTVSTTAGTAAAGESVRQQVNEADKDWDTIRAEGKQAGLAAIAARRAAKGRPRTSA